MEAEELNILMCMLKKRMDKVMDDYFMHAFKQCLPGCYFCAQIEKYKKDKKDEAWPNHAL